MSTGNAHNGAMLSPAATQIETASGRFVDVLSPDPEAIDLDDIAHALSLTCRYGGHVKRFYSVAEHAILVHDLLRFGQDERNTALLLAALLHDAAEAYLGDVVAPLKYAQRSEEFDYPGSIHRASRLDDFTGAYKRISSRMDAAIIERFGLPCGLFDADAVAVADMWALRIEAKELTRTGGSSWRWPGALPCGGELPATVTWIGGLEPGEAASVFLSRVRHLLRVADFTEAWT